MVNLIPILYRSMKYPEGITPKIQEISAHFDSKIINPNLEYLLHTEYSWGRRKFTSPPVEKLSAIKKAHHNGIPKLWFDEKWVKDFVKFILKYVENMKAPKIIEIHPPFDDYCENLSKFIELYMRFEDEILSYFPNAEVFIENRYGSMYTRGNFVLSTVEHLNALSELISLNNLKLRIALDIPQLFSAHGFTIGNFSKLGISKLFNKLKSIRKYIASIHLWGKCYEKTIE